LLSLAYADMLVFALYGSGADEVTLDVLACCIPLVFLTEVVVMMWIHGVLAYLLWFDDPDVKLKHRGTVLLTLISLVGAVMVIISHMSDDVNINIPRFILASSTLLVFVKNSSFSKLLHLVYLSLKQCVGVLAITLGLMTFYVMICQDLFGQTAKDDSDKLFFGSQAQAWASMFRLFVGEGWHDILYAVSDATTVAARFLVCWIIFSLTLLISQLIVGIIINLFQELQDIESVQLYYFLEPLYRNYSDTDREQVLEHLRALNWRLYDIHNMIQDLKAPLWMVKELGFKTSILDHRYATFREDLKRMNSGNHWHAGKRTTSPTTSPGHSPALGPDDPTMGLAGADSLVVSDDLLGSIESLPDDLSPTDLAAAEEAMRRMGTSMAIDDGSPGLNGLVHTPKNVPGLVPSLSFQLAQMSGSGDL